MGPAVIYMTAGIFTVLSVPDTVGSPLVGNTNVNFNKRSVSCLSGRYYNTADGDCQACITCGKGEYFNDDCYGISGPGTCSNCGKGYYQSKESHADVSCSICKHCQHRVIISKCTRTENTICGDCLPGYYERTFFGRKTCVICPTKGDIPKPCREKPTTVAVPPVALKASTPQPMTTPFLTTTPPDTTTPSLTTPSSVATASFSTTIMDGLTTTPATMPNETEIMDPQDEEVEEVDDFGVLYPFGHWSSVAAVAISLLFFLVFIGCLLYKRGCKSDSSSASYSSPAEIDTHEHISSYREEAVENVEEGNCGGGITGSGENLPMLTVLHRVSSVFTDSIGATPCTSATSSPRNSLISDMGSLASRAPSFNNIPLENESKQTTHAPDTSKTQKQLLADISLKLNSQIGNSLLDDFKTYCRLSEKLDIRTTEDCTSFPNCVESLIQHNDFTPDAAAAFLYSYFESKNLQRYLKIITEKFPHVSSQDENFPNGALSSSNLLIRSKGANCDWTYYWKIVKCLEKNGMKFLKLKDITTIVDGIDSMLESNIKGVGSMFAIAVALNVRYDVAHTLKRYRSLEHLLTMSKPDLTVIDFVHKLTLHNRIAAVKEIYNKLSCDCTMVKLKRHMLNGENIL